MLPNIIKIVKLKLQHDLNPQPTRCFLFKFKYFFMDNLIQRYEGKGTLIYDNSEKYVGEFKKG